MPREIIPEREDLGAPPGVYVSLRDLVALQHDAHGFSFLPRHAVHSLLSGRHRSRLRGRGLDFDEVRKYVAGDDIRNIDWRVTARVGDTHTKVFTEERERPVILLVDQRSSMFFGSRTYMKSVVAAHAAALAAWRTLDVGDRIGGIVFDDSRLDYVAPKRDRRSVQRLLQVIAERNQKLGPRSLAGDENMLLTALSRALQLVSHDYLIVLISDFNGFSDEGMKLCIQLSRHNDLVAARILDPVEEKLPGANLVMGDGEYQTALGRMERAHVSVNESLEKRIVELRKQMKHYGIPFLHLSTLEPVSSQLRNLIGLQAKIRRRS